MRVPRIDFTRPTGNPLVKARIGYGLRRLGATRTKESGNPFPDSRPLRELIEGEPTTHELPPDAPWRFMGVSSLVTWQRCDCPWWHRLPFVGRFVHSDLP